MGIGGAGMSAIALIALRRGVPVTGCDVNPAGAADPVCQGARVQQGHDAAHVQGARAVVYTAAVPREHPELERARKVGVPVLTRAEALGAIVASGRVVGVAGTHGKTTTTAMLTAALVAAGRDPTGIVGGRVAAWEGNIRFGSDELYVVEADEYDRSFLELDPAVALVTNVEADHMECYGSVEELEAAFVEYAGRAGCVLVGADDGGAKRVGRAVGQPVWQVGLAPDADVRLTKVARESDLSAATLALPDGTSVELRLRVPGLHNLRNGAMALGAVAALEADVKRAADGLAAFEGVGRRFEHVGTVDGITVIDDYAHHPSEIAATLGAVRQRYPAARIVAVLQPHLYSRTAALGPAMGIALALADHAVVTEIYAAREPPIVGVTGELVVRAARRAGAHAEWIPDQAALLPHLDDVLVAGDVLVTLGAGDITETGREFVRRRAGEAA
jgi:UDP-N-acetylmuramate--alanine ligase